MFFFCFYLLLLFFFRGGGGWVFLLLYGNSVVWLMKTLICIKLKKRLPQFMPFHYRVKIPYALLVSGWQKKSISVLIFQEQREFPLPLITYNIGNSVEVNAFMEGLAGIRLNLLFCLPNRYTCIFKSGNTKLCCRSCPASSARPVPLEHIHCILNWIPSECNIWVVSFSLHRMLLEGQWHSK